MLRVSKLTDYGTVIMFHLARYPERLCSAVEVAAAVGLAVPTASKLLKHLARCGLLSSRRGANGGYMLASPAGGISVADIIEAMEGPFGLTECSGAGSRCPQEAACGAREPWQFINRVVRDTLENITLADVAASNLRAVGSAAIRIRTEPAPEGGSPWPTRP